MNILNQLKFAALFSASWFVKTGLYIFAIAICIFGTTSPPLGSELSFNVFRFSLQMALGIVVYTGLFLVTMISLTASFRSNFRRRLWLLCSMFLVGLIFALLMLTELRDVVGVLVVLIPVGLGIVFLIEYIWEPLSRALRIEAT